jgi:hypothetical protein
MDKIAPSLGTSRVFSIIRLFSALCKVLVKEIAPVTDVYQSSIADSLKELFLHNGRNCSLQNWRKGQHP